jgi:hypothetical protein
MRRTVYVLVLISLLNGVAFFVHVSVLGGSAMNGRIENGKYYVGEHGRYTEVSATAFERSRWHERSAIATTALMLLAGGVWVAAAKAQRSHVP